MAEGLIVAFYDGKYTGDAASLTRLCEIGGSAVPYDRPPYPLLEEVVHLLEICAERYSTPRPAGECMTVFIGRKGGTEVEQLVRLDVLARNGRVSAMIAREDGSRANIGPVACDEDDDVATILRKILSLQDEFR